MSDMRDWPDLSDCACDGRPIRNSAALGPELHYVTCTAPWLRSSERMGEGCARHAAGLTRAEAAAAWNALQAEAWRGIRVMPRKYSVGVFRHERDEGRAPLFLAYLRDYSPTWEGCTVVEVQAFDGKDAKRRAIAKVRGDVDSEARREFESRMP